jgi:hypothetical protein
MHKGLSVVSSRGDVQEGDLIGTFLIVAARDLDWIAGIADIDELDAFDHAPGIDVETGDDPFG